MSLEFAYGELLVLETKAKLSIPQREVCGLVCSAIKQLSIPLEKSTRSRYTQPFNAVLIDSVSVGRPIASQLIFFTVMQLHFLIKNQYTTLQIAEIIGRLVQTIQRKMSE